MLTRELEPNKNLFPNLLPSIILHGSLASADSFWPIEMIPFDPLKCVFTCPSGWVREMSEIVWANYYHYFELHHYTVALKS
jgi:hypothetical protein